MRLDAATSKNNGGTNSNTLSIPFTNAGDIMVVTVVDSRAATVNSVKFNGVDFTLGVSEVNSSISWARIYYLPFPAVMTDSVEIVYATSQTGYIAGVVSLFGHFSVTPLGNTNKVPGTAQNKSLSLDTVSYGSFVFDGIGAQGGVHSRHASQTSLIQNDNRVASYKQIGASGTGSGNMSWTATASAAYAYASLEIRADRGAARRYWQGMDFSNFSKGVF